MMKCCGSYKRFELTDTSVVTHGVNCFGGDDDCAHFGESNKLQTSDNLHKEICSPDHRLTAIKSVKQELFCIRVGI